MDLKSYIDKGSISYRLYAILLIVIIAKVKLIQGQALWKISAFENCFDGFIGKGNCTTIYYDGALQAVSASTILLDGISGFADFGDYTTWGCPFSEGSCPEGFSFFGWMKFRGYPKCEVPAILISTKKFNIHLLGNGHLKAYAWMDNITEYFIETTFPILLDSWYSIILQFNVNKTTGAASLGLLLNDQSYISSVPRCNHTYFPPSANFIFGSDGNGTSFANVQLDRSFFSYPPTDTKTLFEYLINFSGATSACTYRNGISPLPLSCYYLAWSYIKWPDAYKQCNQTAWSSGYPVGRLAQFAEDSFFYSILNKSILLGYNVSSLNFIKAHPLKFGKDFIWNALVSKLNQTSGYPAWLGGGQNYQWLDYNGIPTEKIQIPSSIDAVPSASNNGCLSLNTKNTPWQWAEIPCDTYQWWFLCEMSWPCLFNPCQNNGVCQSRNYNQLCHCWPGTSGQYCEIGTPKLPTCLGNCSCRLEEPSTYTPYPTSVNVAKISPFESLSDGYVSKGNVRVVESDGALQGVSVNTVLIDGATGYLDFGTWSGCPFDLSTLCPYGFAFFGWMKFRGYPTKCTDSAVLISTTKFNIHILGSGHLAVYVWQDNATEYFVETNQPVSLDIWYPIILLYYSSPSNIGRIELSIQGQSYATTNVPRPRTFMPPSNNFVMGSDGNNSKFAKVQFDRSFYSVPVPNWKTIWQNLIDIPDAEVACYGRSGILTKPLNCYYVQTSPQNWTNAYVQCNRTAWISGYPNGRLAWIDTADEWDLVIDQLLKVEVGSVWLGGGNSFKKFDSSRKEVGQTYYLSPKFQLWYPSVSNGCIILNTTMNPYQVTEISCDQSQPFICQLTWGCLISNPCKNLGLCTDTINGQACQCRPGTWGLSCENGTPSASCVNSCPCLTNNQPISEITHGYCNNVGPYHPNVDADLSAFFMNLITSS